MPTIGLVGGPCDGTNMNVSSAQLASGQVTCQGTLYIRTNAVHAGDLITFATSDAISKATQGPVPIAAMKAWTHLMHTLAHKGPSAHRRIVAATARANRLGRK